MCRRRMLDHVNLAQRRSLPGRGAHKPRKVLVCQLGKFSYEGLSRSVCDALSILDTPIPFLYALV